MLLTLTVIAAAFYRTKWQLLPESSSEGRARSTSKTEPRRSQALAAAAVLSGRGKLVLAVSSVKVCAWALRICKTAFCNKKVLKKEV